MRKPGTDENNVQPSDVLCDFCEREWADDVPMIEGHQGSCICGKCLTIAYTEILLHEGVDGPPEFACPMCLETSADRATLERGDEPGWQGPVRPEAVICRRCVSMAARALDRDRTFDWKVPQKV